MSSLNANGIRCAGVTPNPEISYTNAGTSAFFALITIPGNLLVLIVVLKNPSGKLRTPFNWFILNLAVADLLVGFLVEPLSALVHIREGLEYKIKYRHYLRPVYFTSCTASVFSLAMLTIDRYIAITSPIKYRAALSNSRAAISSAIIWAISIGLPFLRDKIGFLWYFFVFGNASVLVTFFVLLFAFVRIDLKLRAQIREFDACSTGNRTQSNAIRTEAKITKTLMLMLVAFMLAYTPSLVMIYLMNFCTICSCQAIHWFRDLSFIFIVLNSCVNPFLYALRLPNFKEAVHALFTRNPRNQRTGRSHLQGVHVLGIQGHSRMQTSSASTTSSSVAQRSSVPNDTGNPGNTGYPNSSKDTGNTGNSDFHSSSEITGSPESNTARHSSPENTGNPNSRDHPVDTGSPCETGDPNDSALNLNDVYTSFAEEETAEAACKGAHINPVITTENEQ